MISDPREIARLEKQAAAIEAAGLGDAYRLIGIDTASDRLVRDVLGSVAQYLLEAGLIAGRAA